MDTNWFFSSLAQCAAAMVSVLAALAVAALLREGEMAVRWRARQRTAARRLADHARDALVPRRAFIGFWERNIATALNQPGGQTVHLPILPALTGAQGGPVSLPIADQDHAPLERLLAQAHRLDSMLSPAPLLAWFRGEPHAAMGLGVLATTHRELVALESMWMGGPLAPLVAGGADELGRLLAELRRFDRLRSDAQAAIPLAYLRWIIGLIAATGLAGIVYPLLQLSAPDPATRAIATGVFAACLLALAGVLWQLAERVRESLLVGAADLEPESTAALLEPS